MALRDNLKWEDWICPECGIFVKRGINHRCHPKAIRINRKITKKDNKK